MNFIITNKPESVLKTNLKLYEIVITHDLEGFHREGFLVVDISALAASKQITTGRTGTYSCHTNVIEQEMIDYRSNETGWGSTSNVKELLKIIPKPKIFAKLRYGRWYKV